MRQVWMWMMVLALAAQDQDRIKVVTTLNVLKHFAEEVGGDRVRVQALAHPRQDPHYVRPSPDLAQIARDARLFVYMGRGLDLWAKNVWDSSGNSRIQPGADGHLEASRDCSVEELPQVVSRQQGDIHPSGNPHVWLSPMNAKIIAANLARALSQIDPGHARTYAANLEAFHRKIDTAMFGQKLIEEVGKADRLWLKLQTGKLDAFLKERNLPPDGWWKKSEPLRGVKVVSYHKTYIYFAKTFGFEIAGELEERPGIPPTPRQKDAVVELVRREKVRAILNDTFYPTEAADYVAAQTGAKVLVVPIDVGAVEGVDTYVRLIDYLLDKLVGAHQ